MSKGMDRDRAVDETGGQIAVFGRIGARPFSVKEMQKLYMNPDGTPWTVTNIPNMADFVGRRSNTPYIDIKALNIPTTSRKEVK
jgi:hypothetical protein